MSLLPQLVPSEMSEQLLLALKQVKNQQGLTPTQVHKGKGQHVLLKMSVSL